MGLDHLLLSPEVLLQLTIQNLRTFQTNIPREQCYLLKDNIIYINYS